MRFSERIGVIAPKPLQVEEMDAALRNRICNFFNSLDEYWYSYDSDIARSRSSDIVDALGFLDKGYTSNLTNIKSIILNKEWFIVYDFIEVLIETLSKNEKTEIVGDLNKLLIEEKAGYRIVNIDCKSEMAFEIVPITDPLEILSLEQASSTPYDSVNEHILKATAFYSNRQNPDYPNSIKESISAVESLCCHLADDRKATLGKALKKLESDGWVIHASFKTALEKLYGYTSDEDGIRHGGFDSSKADAEDALFMLVSCSAFINYLIEKRRKLSAANEGLNTRYKE